MIVKVFTIKQEVPLEKRQHLPHFTPFGSEMQNNFSHGISFFPVSCGIKKAHKKPKCQCSHMRYNFKYLALQFSEKIWQISSYKKDTCCLSVVYVSWLTAEGENGQARSLLNWNFLFKQRWSQTQFHCAMIITLCPKKIECSCFALLWLLEFQSYLHSIILLQNWQMTENWIY